MSIHQTAAAALAVSIALGVSTASAGSCGKNAKGFDAWLAAFKQEAADAGISQRTIGSALSGASYDAAVIKLDRNQRHFKQSFEVFARKRVTADRVTKGKALLKRHAGLFKRIEARFGVPPAVLVAIWGLETDFGSNRGSMSSIRSLATLGYDCRRSPMFTNELLAALKIIDRGDMAAAAMRGGWAGEIGQTQFMPSKYVMFAVDFDGNKRRDLIRSVPDVLASTANYLKGYGWRRGERWTEGNHNFGVIEQWNKSPVYAKTVAYFAAKLSDANAAADQ
jgi:lytic murein transglycosylase